MAKPSEGIELNQIDPKDDDADKLSEKYMSLDENGKPIEDEDSQSVVEYKLTPYAISDTVDEKYERVKTDSTKPNQVAHKIAKSGAVYAVPNKSQTDEADEYEKYTRLEEDATSDTI